jgi:hypothetical protein
VSGRIDPAVRSSLLWGAVGAFSYLVLLQAYHAIAGEFVGLGPMLGVAAVVFVVSAVAAHVSRPHVARWSQRS